MVHTRPLTKQPQGLYLVQPQSTITAALPCHSPYASITVPTHLGAQLRTITGQQDWHLQGPQLAVYRDNNDYGTITGQQELHMQSPQLAVYRDNND